MTQYKVFTHPSGDNEAVKQGWSWPAFFFSYIWAFWKKQYLLGATVALGLFSLGFAVGMMRIYENASPYVNLLCLFVNIVFGLGGNRWRERNLLSRGYEEAGFIGADNGDKAVSVFLKTSQAQRA